MLGGTATHCAFTGNSAGDLGGGMYSGLATNCTFTGNSAGAGGGMLGGTAVNCTLTGNSALHDGGGISLGTAVNCIVWGNTPNEVAGSDPNVSYSCLSVATVGTGNITANPMFLDAGDGDLRIQPGSPCIDTGTASGAPSMDILGVPRPQGAGYDMGAYEVEVLVSVPDLSGLVRAAAREMVAAAQLYVGNETGEYHPAVPADHVIRQNPLADTEVAQWTPVDLVISKGPEPVPVPDVVGQTQDAAGGAITGIGLVVGTVTLEYSLTVPAGTVTGQTPAPGTAVLPGTSVDLVISKGGIAVPDVVGQPRALAESAITGAGLVLGSVTEVYSVSVAAGSVISQSTAAGTELPPGTAVSIVVSLGAAPVVEGEGEPVTPDAARQQLASAYATADTNGDGVLSFAEAATAMPGLTQAVFDGLDTNGDGQLSADELGVENGSGCAGCPGGKSAFDPGRCMGDLFLIGLGALGLAAMSALWRP